MGYFTYILQSEESGMLYIGQSQDIVQRLLRHNSNRSKFTRNIGPGKIIFCCAFETRSEAVAMEARLKAIKNRDRILDWISRQQGSVHPD